MAQHFQDYQDLYGVTSADVMAAAEEPRRDLVGLDNLVTELHTDANTVEGAVDGVIVQGVKQNPATAGDSARDLHARGTYAVGVLELFGHYATSFDQGVDKLNTELDKQVAIASGTYAGPEGSGDLGPLLAGPLATGETPAQARTRLMREMRPQWTKLHHALDQGAELAAKMFKQGPQNKNVRWLIQIGLIPLESATLYPTLKLSWRDRQLAMQYLASANPGDPWSRMEPGDATAWNLAVQGDYDCDPLDPLMPQYYIGDDPDAGGGTGYYGGGFITGPDGRKYPIVIPGLEDDDGNLLNGSTDPSSQVGSLGGRDDGWHTLNTETGIDEFGNPTSGTDKTLIFLGMLAGGPGPVDDGRTLRPDLLDNVVLDPRSDHAYLHDGGDALPQSPGIATGDPRDNPLDPKIPDPPGMDTGASGKYSGPLDLAIGAGNAVNTVKHLDDDLTHTYEITYEQNDDGRIRANVSLYDVYDIDGRPQVTESKGYVDSDGDIGRVQSLNGQSDIPSFQPAGD